MSDNNGSPLESSGKEGEPVEGLDCACGKRLLFDATGDLRHSDGSEMCVALDVVIPGFTDEVSRVSPQLADEDLPPWSQIGLSIGDWQERQDSTSWWETFGWGVFAVFCAMAAGLFFMLMYVIAHWPHSTY